MTVPSNRQKRKESRARNKKRHYGKISSQRVREGSANGKRHFSLSSLASSQVKMDPFATNRTVHRRPSVTTFFHIGLVMASVFLIGRVEPHVTGDFSIQQLLNKRFPHRISDDIYLDPCKAGKRFTVFVCINQGNGNTGKENEHKSHSVNRRHHSKRPLVI